MISRFYLPTPIFIHFYTRCRFRRTTVVSAVRRRHHRRLLLKYFPNYSVSSSPSTNPTPPPLRIRKLSDNSLQITLNSPPNAFQDTESKLNQFLDYGREAFDDLRSLVRYDEDRGGVVISCRRSTIEIFAGLLISSLLVAVVFRGIFNRRKNGREGLIYRRDRSLGGKEVLVGKSEPLKKISNPLSSYTSTDYPQKKREGISRRRSRKEQLPRWWPQVVDSGPVETSNKEEYQKMANEFVREITDSKMAGEDVSMNDIVQLRNICKTYGVKAHISTENMRDSLYRLSVNFILNFCESTGSATSITISDEGVHEFLAGLAANIGLESTRAVRMVGGAVAAHTNSKILQAWALEAQGKHSEALAELSKVCVIHRLFAPERNSPEMEMVARSLTKSLSIDQREFIYDLFSSISGGDVIETVVEALGLE